MLSGLRSWQQSTTKPICWRSVASTWGLESNTRQAEFQFPQQAGNPQQWEYGKQDATQFPLALVGTICSGIVE